LETAAASFSPFPKLEKHLPTNLYMLYPMAQSIARVCVEIDNKKARIVHRHHHHHPFFWCAATPQRFTVGAANNTPAC
jgi:hypothetical protein